MIEFRKLTHSDLQVIHNWRSSVEIAKWMINDSPISYDEHVQWFEKALVDEIRKVRVISFDGIDCGVISWEDEGGGRFSFGIYIIGTLVNQRGVGRIALKKLFKKLFTEDDASLVSATVLSENVRAIKAYTHLGMVVQEESRQVVERSSGKAEMEYLVIHRSNWVQQEEIAQSEVSCESRFGRGGANDN